MKHIYFGLLCLLLFPMSINAQTSGGPDMFGYEWINSNDANGPTFNWIDISGTGTEVTGLADDNSVGMFNMGVSFIYYGTSYNAVKIGSNGWISFFDIGNIANCFPTIPTSGGGVDNLVCPFMTDLNIAGASNPSKVYYQIVDNTKFIISYHNVPFWVNANPDFQGDNTFQIILDTLDNSVTFQYLDMDETFLGSSGCSGSTTDSVVGIENADGTDGLQILGDEIMPTDNLAIRIEDTNVLSVTSFTDNKNGLSIFPNPSKDRIRILGLHQTEKYTIYNALGFIIKKGTLANKEYMDVEFLSTGLYFITMDGYAPLKFIKK